MREALVISAIMMALTMLLRKYAQNTDRRKRIAIVFVAFVSFQVLTMPNPSEFISEIPQPFSFSPPTARDNPMYAKSQNASLIIFYNLFIPQGDDGAANAIRVIEDQMGQVSTALARLESLSNKEEKGVVFYNSIGNEAGFPPEKMGDLCHRLHPRLDCVQLQHYESGTESVTLTSLHDFCHSGYVADANQTRVAYLHSKGSYHDHGKQTPWRQELTNSSLHPDCLHPPDDKCDVCGAQYFTMFASMFPGNMWTAKCSYIQKLLRPDEGGEYERRKEASIKQYFMLKAEGILHNAIGWHQDVFYGLDRYVWEHWVGSHPSLVPCDMLSTDVVFWDITDGRVRPEHYEWAMGPRRGMVFQKETTFSKDEEANFRQYYYLAGNMIKWLGLYDAVPAQDSWVWSHFPASQRWKDLVSLHGKNAVHEMVKSSKSQLHSAFASNHSESETFDEESLSRPDPPIVVFYQISYHDGKKENDPNELIKDQFDTIYMGQYDNVTNSFNQQRKVLLYYTMSGGSKSDNQFVLDLCKTYSDRIICHQLGTFESDIVSGETLHQMHQFCIAKPTSNVIYISNQLGGFGAADDAKEIHATTSAVMSKICSPSEDTCNVCGKEFYPLPFSHFTGNMFSASCSYVKDLLPPPIFEKKMYNIAGDAYLAQLRQQVTSQLFQFTPEILGFHQHSIQHWIGSHPDLKPCDIAPIHVEGSDHTKHKQMDQYKWGLAPRRGSAPPGKFRSDVELNLRSKREVAFREYYYLAGNVYRWHMLYDNIPNASSWAWQWFPDGKLWETAAKVSGTDALNAIAKQLSSESGMELHWVE